jgi:hypothetical protein
MPPRGNAQRPRQDRRGRIREPLGRFDEQVQDWITLLEKIKREFNAAGGRCVYTLGVTWP